VAPMLARTLAAFSLVGLRPTNGTNGRQEEALHRQEARVKLTSKGGNRQG